MTSFVAEADRGDEINYTLDVSEKFKEPKQEKRFDNQKS